MTLNTKLLTKSFGENREAAFAFYWQMYNKGHEVHSSSKFDRSTRTETWIIAYSEAPTRNGAMPIDELAARETCRANLVYI